MKITKILDDNIKHLEDDFDNCGDIVKRKIPIGNGNMNMYVCYLDGMADSQTVNEVIIFGIMYKPELIVNEFGELKENIYESLKNDSLWTADIGEEDEFEAISQAVLCGDTILMIDGSEKAITVSTKGFSNRGVPTAETEVVVQGSKEAFSEVFRTNTMLIRRRIRDTKLKAKQYRLGRRSNTDVALMYLEDLVRPEILQEVKDRILNIDIDAIQDSGYVEQLIEDDWMSPFPQIQVTERPDKASAAILEGRLVIIVDNSPFVLIVPVTMNSFFQSSEDYYQRFEIMSFTRLIRFIAGIFTMCLPGFYIATSVYHPSMIPMHLAYKIAESRENIPFPVVIEILIMDLAFELLREAGIRLPGAVGSTIGIVGGLIIGQAAVEAGIVSPIVVIIVALTGIASFSIPHFSLVSGFRLSKYLIIITSAALGLYGFWLGILFILIHLVSLKSFSIPYMYPFTSGECNDYSDFKDTIFRLPIFKMKERPIFANQKNKTRLKSDGNIRKKE